MMVWLDAQLSPGLAIWLKNRFELEVRHVAELGLVHASDPEIFRAARDAGAVVLTKDRDFVELVKRRGPPPHIVWITSANTSNARMRQVLEASFAAALRLLNAGERYVQIKATE